MAKITQLKNQYEPFYAEWANGQENETPIIADALNQLEKQLREVYDAVGQIETADTGSTTPLQSAVTNYKNSVQENYAHDLVVTTEGKLQLINNETVPSVLSEIQFESGTEQGQFKIEDTNINITNLQTGSTPTFAAIKLGDDDSETLTQEQYSGNASSATSVNITNNDTENNAVVSFKVGSGTPYSKTINNVAHATSAQQLDEKPELTATENNTITVTAGEKTSEKFTVPFATETSKLQSPITITLTGDVTEEEVEFDGSSNITLPINITDDSHNHIIENVDGLKNNLTDLGSRLAVVESFFKTDESASIVDDITTLKEIVDEFRKDNEAESSINNSIKELQEKPVVTYTTTEGDYAAEDEIVFICGDSQPYRLN